FHHRGEKERMNKSGPGGGGPTAAAAAAAAQKQKTLLQRVEGDIANIVDNFSHLVNVARGRVSDTGTRLILEVFVLHNSNCILHNGVDDIKLAWNFVCVSF
ncbi:mediator of RNA polymerase II transcription subunit 22A-like, partial [Trifolium medium]|nr:mediator of RNA polymerase II transcription subunit 22A-like [Trifolium medium]